MHLRGNLILFLTAFIWGTTFAVQIVGMASIGPFTYAASRFLLGFLFLLLVYLALTHQRAARRRAGTYHSGFRAGIIAGVFMFIGVSMQQYAMLYTTAGKTSFITALYIILVPLAGIFLGRRVYRENTIGGLIVLVGLYLLALQGETGIGYGDLVVLVSSLFWTAQILYIDRYAAFVDPIELSVAQIGVATLGSLVLALALEDIEIAPILSSWWPIIYGGVMSAGVAYTLQIIGQSYTDPAEAAIIMSFEAVFGALGGLVLLGETMSGVQTLGCVLMFAGMILTQLRPFLEKKRRRKQREKAA